MHACPAIIDGNLIVKMAAETDDSQAMPSQLVRKCNRLLARSSLAAVYLPAAQSANPVTRIFYPPLRFLLTAHIKVISL
jgi:hypothetical protein